MANWSSDTYYFGKAIPADIPNNDWRNWTSEQQRIIRALWFEAHDLPYMITGITTVGPAVCVSGSGRYGCGLPIASELWAELVGGIVVHYGHDGFGDDCTRTIWIAGERVDDQSRKIWEQERGYTTYLGRTPDEEVFFKALWVATGEREDLTKRSFADLKTAFAEKRS